MQSHKMNKSYVKIPSYYSCSKCNKSSKRKGPVAKCCMGLKIITVEEDNFSIIKPTIMAYMCLNCEIVHRLETEALLCCGYSGRF